MAFELSKDLTFFSEIINSTNLQPTEFSKAKKPSPKKTRRSLQKENTASDKAEPKKAGKSGRQPLKVLQANTKPSLSPTAEGKIPSKRKSAAKENAIKFQTKKEKQTFPKIVVHEDGSGKAKEQGKRKTVSGLSKSWDGSTTTSRKSHPGCSKSPKLAVSKTKNVRRSCNDIPNVKGSRKTEKRVVEDKKSPAGRSSLKFKPGQPEFDEMLSKLQTLFPNVDPEFIKLQFIKYKGSLSEIIEFLVIKEKNNDLPKKTDYLRRLEMEKLQNKFMENFSVVNFLKMIPDPWEHFLKTEKHNSTSYLAHSLHYLKSKYKNHYMRTIQAALAKNDNSLYLADKELKKKNVTSKLRSTNRSKFECDAGRPASFNVQFIYEVAFIENETKIKSHIKKAKTARNKKFNEAKEAGTLLECQSCNDFSLLQDDVVNCPANHVFCKDCVVKYVEIEMWKDNFNFKCLLKCEEKFSLDTLQAVLSPPVMAKIIQRNQIDKNKSSVIKNLAYCPFCYYVIIISPESTVFKCPNPSCTMETCRYCKKLSHIPQKCNELEKFDETSLEVEVEIEKQEEEERKENSSLKCTDCQGEFIKKEDSNQMVCPCGATICSICQQPFRECEHFSAGPGVGSTHNLSSSSEDDDGEDTEAEDDFERSSNCSENLMEMLLSGSENF